MRLLKRSKWLLSLAATFGVAATSFAQDAQVRQADAIFGNQEPSLIRQIGYEAGCLPDTCLPECCDYVPCDDCGCVGYGGGEGGTYLFGPDDPFTLSNALFGDEPPLSIGGWTQIGYTNRSTGLFNTNPGRVNLHQQWLYIERAADGSEGFDMGFRMDLMYGTDADDTQAFGNNPGTWDFPGSPNHWAAHGIYGWAIPQLYAEFAYEDLSVKVGHFYTLLGYEVVTAPDNFFYSHAFTMYNSEAFTHTGVLGTYSAGDDVTLYGGWTLGWDTGFDQFGDGNSFLGGASVSVLDDVTLTYILTAGDFGANGNGYTHSIVADFALTDDLNYVFQSDLARFAKTDTETIGINQYLLYSLTDTIGVGGRMEWWKSDGTDFYALTTGVNYKPMANLVLRPEIRYQWAPEENNLPPAMQAFPVEEGVIFGMDAILTY